MIVTTGCLGFHYTPLLFLYRLELSSNNIQCFKKNKSRPYLHGVIGLGNGSGDGSRIIMGGTLSNNTATIKIIIYQMLMSPALTGEETEVQRAKKAAPNHTAKK